MTTVVLPWQGGCPQREEALSWVLERYSALGWSVTVAERSYDRFSRCSGETWCKAAAVMPAVEAAPDGIVIVADADVWCDELPAAVEAMEWAPWAIPHSDVVRLGPAATKALLTGGDWKAEELAQARYAGYPGGGIVVSTRETLLEVPLDPAFVGWGQEDESWAYALATLVGNPYRGFAELLHLYHPPQPRLTRRRGSEESWQHRLRYLRARGNPEAMRKLVKEARDALDNPPLHADLPDGERRRGRLREPGPERDSGREPVRGPAAECR